MSSNRRRTQIEQEKMLMAGYWNWVKECGQLTANITIMCKRHKTPLPIIEHFNDLPNEFRGYKYNGEFRTIKDDKPIVIRNNIIEVYNDVSDIHWPAYFKGAFPGNKPEETKKYYKKLYSVMEAAIRERYNEGLSIDGISSEDVLVGLKLFFDELL